MAEFKTMAQEMEDILASLRELEQLDFQYRTYQRADGTKPISRSCRSNFFGRISPKTSGG